MPHTMDLILKACVIPKSNILSIRVPYKGKHVRTSLHVDDFFRFVAEGYSFRISKIKEFLYLVAEHPDRRGKRVYVHRHVKPELADDPTQVVHHKDLNPLNNAPDNLELMSIGHHNRLHAQTRAEAKITEEANSAAA